MALNWNVLNRDVLVIGKRLAKERDEMGRQIGRLYEDVTSLHQVLICINCLMTRVANSSAG